MRAQDDASCKDGEVSWDGLDRNRRFQHLLQNSPKSKHINTDFISLGRGGAGEVLMEAKIK